MSNELMHHGILGQKWGVRRYQNEDGSLTPAGKKRYSELEKDSTELVKQFGKMETMNRAITKGWDHKTQILVPTDVKQEFSKELKKYEKICDQILKKYGNEPYQDIFVGKDGRDYVEVHINDKISELNYRIGMDITDDTYAW